MRRMFVILILLLVPLSCARAEEPGVWFSPLDELGRTGDAVAILTADSLGSRRESISGITPAGFVHGEAEYNRCHLIAARLAPGTEVPENLFTGTAALNREMIPIENEAVAYVRAGGVLLYRVTPEYRGRELVPRGISVYARALDGGELSVSVSLRNAQEGVAIDYLTGESGPEGRFFVLNVHSGRFHRPSCAGAADIRPGNRELFRGAGASLIRRGFEPCQSCAP